jgi:hypothetical protein
MSESRQKPILLTGAIRSGTTWVGEILKSSSLVGEIYEPFNLLHRMGICPIKWDYQYTYISKENETEFIEKLSDMLQFKYSPLNQILHMRNFRNLGGFFRDYPKCIYWRFIKKPRPLIKDPIALFSTEWLAKRFNMDVIILIRHPASFAWSYKRINEKNRFPDLLAQEHLMKEVLYPFNEKIRDYANNYHDPIDQAILMWNIVYTVVNQFRQNHPDWIFKKHEDLALDPITEFNDLFSRITLKYNRKVRNKIIQTTNIKNPAEAPEGIMHQLNRNSRQAIHAWRHRLSSSEIIRIRKATDKIARIYYSENSW